MHRQLPDGTWKCAGHRVVEHIKSEAGNRNVDLVQDAKKILGMIFTTCKESQSLKGLAKIKYDKEHKDSLSKYPESKECMQSLLQKGDKITPKHKMHLQKIKTTFRAGGGLFI